MKVLMFITFFSLSFAATSQQLHHPSIWPTEYNVQYHMTSVFINRMIDRGHTQMWNEELQQFTSPIYDHLTFPEGANTSISFSMASLKFALTGYFKSDFSDFTPEKFEQYFKKGKKTEKGTIHYDSLGRMTEMRRKLTYSWNSKRKERFIFSYDGRKIDFQLKQTTFNYFGNYQGKNIKIRYRPVRQKTFWELTQYMNKMSCTDSVISTHRAYVNGRKNFNPNYTRWKYMFKWDSIGRLKHEKITVGGDSVHRNSFTNYSDQFLDRKELATKWIMKSPPIRRWFDSINEPLYLTKQNGEGSMGVVRTKNFKLFMILSQSGGYPCRLIDHVYDSISEYKAVYSIRRIDSLDSIPYQPKKTKRLDITPLIENSHPGRPHGLLDVDTEAYRRSEIILENGWTIIRYQRGSKNYSRAALGHKPWVRLDLLYDRFVFVDPSGKVKYVYHYKKLYRIN